MQTAGNPSAAGDRAAVHAPIDVPIEVPTGAPADVPVDVRTDDPAGVPVEVQELGYDAQTDLALPEQDQVDADIVLTPYATSVVDEGPAAGYDIDRDTAP